MARAFSLPILAWSPLAFGVLAGEFHDGSSDSKRVDRVDGYLGAHADRIVPEVLSIAKAHGVSAGRVALACVLGRGPQIYPIIGARTLAQLADHLGALTLALTADDLARLERVGVPEPSFPGKMWKNAAFVEGGGAAAPRPACAVGSARRELANATGRALPHDGGFPSGRGDCRTFVLVRARSKDVPSTRRGAPRSSSWPPTRRGAMHFFDRA